MSRCTPSIAGSSPSRRRCGELGTLVARGVEPWEVFDAVTKEMCRCVPAEAAGLWRYETSDEITMVAATYHPAAALDASGL